MKTNRFVLRVWSQKWSVGQNNWLYSLDKIGIDTVDELRRYSQLVDEDNSVVRAEYTETTTGSQHNVKAVGRSCNWTYNFKEHDSRMSKLRNVLETL